MRLRSIALYTTGNMCSSRHTTPIVFPSFLLLPKVKHCTKEIVTTCGRTERSHDNCPSYPAKIKHILQVYCKGDLRWEDSVWDGRQEDVSGRG